MNISDMASDSSPLTTGVSPIRLQLAAALLLMIFAPGTTAQTGTAEIALFRFSAAWDGSYQQVSIPNFPPALGHVTGVRAYASASGIEDYYFLFGESLAHWLGITSLQLEFNPVAVVLSPDMQWLTGPSGNFLWGETGPLYAGFGPTRDPETYNACEHTGGYGYSFSCSDSADVVYPLPYGRFYGGIYNLFGGVGHTGIRYQASDGSWQPLPIAMCTQYIGSRYSLDLYIQFDPPATWLVPDGFSNLGGGVAGSSGPAPLLMADGTRQPGDPLFVVITGAQPGAHGFLVAQMPITSPPLLGRPTARNPSNSFQRVIVPITTNGTGQFTATYTWPSNVPAGSSYRLQAWFRDSSAPRGFSRTNAVGIEG